ncbi:MAG: phosphate ABC transporter permease subunit PstC [Tenericutes bacterium GWC2_34_14]|nr:MAG: phosphate ABC transporter permease subunit PstC [Tenericutes bacterium GWA2_35_7]OHE29767.1 MAG: phosphate ABC transporter permease subunit PstC [Tenericutes bacterium GWC2_34_14]OHE34746.1 MAG: phosphate ABC transporter permease subunit PstC [Tenericutes bacterium GWE2_34_108]OHE37393.1 MAG: phosphate ABC transporter permease subunit PstC [Tenericutes bacterium GWF1_35_14]OHE39473.1 MAG: phosphate ABC transporter permease subunit PstC [Tenericutes bacterium GWF2_35_184]OHE44338.1 MAG:
MQQISYKKNKIAWMDVTVKQILRIFAYLSGSFIFIITGVILVKGLIPFVTNNNGIGRVPLVPFLTGDTWLIGDTFASNLYSVGFIIVQTIYVVFLSLFISFPVGVLTALFIAKIAPKKLAEGLRTVVEMLASIPSIIYGLFGAGVILKLVYDFSATLGYQSKGGSSVLSSVIILALMTIPTITTVSEVAIRSVDPQLTQASLALGASPTQTHFKVVLSAAKSGIFTSAILGVGRALGEATAISLVAGGRRAGLSFHLLDTTSTLTTTMLEGMKESAGIDYDIRFSVGIVLMIVILLTNFILNTIKKKVGHVHVK